MLAPARALVTSSSRGRDTHTHIHAHTHLQSTPPSSALERRRRRSAESVSLSLYCRRCLLLKNTLHLGPEYGDKTENKPHRGNNSAPRTRKKRKNLAEQRSHPYTRTHTQVSQPLGAQQTNGGDAMSDGAEIRIYTCVSSSVKFAHVTCPAA